MTHFMLAVPSKLFWRSDGEDEWAPSLFRAVYCDESSEMKTARMQRKIVLVIILPLHTNFDHLVDPQQHETLSNGNGNKFWRLSTCKRHLSPLLQMLKK